MPRNKMSMALTKAGLPSLMNGSLFTPQEFAHSSLRHSKEFKMIKIYQKNLTTYSNLKKDFLEFMLYQGSENAYQVSSST